MNEKAYAPPSVEYAEPWIRFYIQGEMVQERTLSDLTRYFFVQVPQNANYDYESDDEDETFVALEFSDCLWLVPFTSSLSYARKEWREHLIQKRGFFRAVLSRFPGSWQIYQRVPQAGVLTDMTLPEWDTRGPLDPLTDVYVDPTEEDKQNNEKKMRIWAERRRRDGRLPVKVMYAGPWIRFVVNGEVAGERNISDLSRVFWVRAGNGKDLRGDCFCVLDFSDSLWLVPNETPLSFAEVEWRDMLNRNRGFFSANLPRLPWSWLDPWFRRIPFRFQYLPRALVLQGNALPAWKVRGPLDPWTFALLDEQVE